MLTLPILTLPSYSSASSSSSGAIILHGPHHSAQKSTSTGDGDCRTCCAKLSCVSVTMSGEAIIKIKISWMAAASASVLNAEHRDKARCRRRTSAATIATMARTLSSVPTVGAAAARRGPLDGRGAVVARGAAAGAAPRRRGGRGGRRRSGATDGSGRRAGRAGRSAGRQRRQLDGRRGGRLRRQIDADGFFFGLDLAGFFFRRRHGAAGRARNAWRNVGHNFRVQDKSPARAVKLLFQAK